MVEQTPHFLTEILTSVITLDKIVPHLKRLVALNLSLNDYLLLSRCSRGFREILYNSELGKIILTKVLEREMDLPNKPLQERSFNRLIEIYNDSGINGYWRSLPGRFASFKATQGVDAHPY